jgi:hypothetical protein
MRLIQFVLIICSIYGSYGYCQNIFGFSKTPNEVKSGTNLNPVLSPSDFNSAVSTLQKENQTALENQTRQQQQEFSQTLKATNPPPQTIPSPQSGLPEVGATIPVPTPQTIPTPTPNAAPSPSVTAPSADTKNSSPILAPPTSVVNPSGGDLYTGFTKEDNKNKSSKPSSSWSIKY